MLIILKQNVKTHPFKNEYIPKGTCVELVSNYQNLATIRHDGYTYVIYNLQYAKN